MHIQSNSICITVKVYSNNSLGFNRTSKTTKRFSSLNRLPLTVHLCPVHNLLIKFRAKKPRVGVFLHEAVDLGLDLIETGWCWFQKLLSGLFPCPEVYVNLKKRVKGHKGFIHLCITNIILLKKYLLEEQSLSLMHRWEVAELQIMFIWAKCIAVEGHRYNVAFLNIQLFRNWFILTGCKHLMTCVWTIIYVD